MHYQKHTVTKVVDKIRQNEKGNKDNKGKKTKKDSETEQGTYQKL